MVVVSLSHTWP